MFQWKSCEKPRLPRIYTQPIQSLYSTLIREIILQVRKLFIVFLTTCVLLWLFYPQSAFYPWSAVCSLHFTLSLHFTPGLQSAVCSLQSAFYTDRTSCANMQIKIIIFRFGQILSRCFTLLSRQCIHHRKGNFISYSLSTTIKPTAVFSKQNNVTFSVIYKRDKLGDLAASKLSN